MLLITFGHFDQSIDFEPAPTETVGYGYIDDQEELVMDVSELLEGEDEVKADDQWYIVLNELISQIN